MTLDLDALEGLTGDLTPDDLERLNTAAPTPQGSTSTQRVTVVMDDGATYEVTLDARDRRAYALNADRYGLPSISLAGGLDRVDVLKVELLTMFSAWNASRHRQHLHGLDWPAFNARVVEVISHPDPILEPHPLAPGAG